MLSEKEAQYRKHWHLLFWLIIILGIGALGSFLFFWMNQPSVGAITSKNPSSKESSNETGTSFRYQGKYVTFSYPDQYIPYPALSDVKSPLLEQVLFSTAGIEGRKISVVVQDNTSYTLDEYPSVRMRILEKELYQKENLMRGERNFTLFTKTSSVFEVGAFWLEENVVFSIVFSSPIRLQGLRDELLTLLDTLE